MQTYRYECYYNDKPNEIIQTYYTEYEAHVWALNSPAVARYREVKIDCEEPPHDQ
jgi:hypothetical protein